MIFLPSAAQDREIHSYDDWTYVTNQSGLKLVSWAGGDRDIEIPGTIYGIPVTELAEDLFKNNTQIESVYIPDSVTAIGQYAFHGCTSLHQVRLPKGLRRIEQYTFRYCTSLENIELPESLTYIGNNTFAGCVQLRKILIPDSVTNVGEEAFSDCSALESVSISKNLTYLGGNSFRGTPWLSQQTEEEFVLVGNVILLRWNGTGSFVDVPYGVTMITDAFAGNNNVESVTLPATVRRIGQNAFREAVNLKSVTIPDSVTIIDNYAFENCRSLRSVTLPDSITSMGRSVFQNCEKLTRLVIPAKVQRIGAYLLANCEKLTEVVIPSAVTEINATAFSDSPLIQFRVTYDSEGERFARENSLSYTYYLQQTEDYIYSRNEDGIQILKYIGDLFEVEIPEMIDGLPVNRINTAAFQNNPIPKKIILPDSVKTIGDWAFSYMDSLKEIVMSKGLTELGADAFTGSVMLRSVSLPSGLEQIGVEPFEGIPELSVCAAEGSAAVTMLTEMGYSVSDPESCSGEGNDDNIPAGAPVLVNTTAMVPEAAADVPTEISAAGADTSITEAPADGSTASAVPVFTATSTSTQIPMATDTPTMPPTATNTPTMPPTATNTPTMTPTPTAIPTNTPIPEMRNIVYIPEGTERLTTALLENTTEDLTVVIPADVKVIDESIMEGHNLTIVSLPGTEAEAFARKWDLKFLIAYWFEPDVEADK